MNEWGFNPSLCTYKLNSTRRNSWGWWDELDGTALQAQETKFDCPRPSTLPLGHEKLSTILNIYEGAGKKHFFLSNLDVRAGVRADKELATRAGQESACRTEREPSRRKCGHDSLLSSMNKRSVTSGLVGRTVVYEHYDADATSQQTRCLNVVPTLQAVAQH